MDSWLKEQFVRGCAVAERANATPGEIAKGVLILFVFERPANRKFSSGRRSTPAVNGQGKALLAARGKFDLVLAGDPGAWQEPCGTASATPSFVTVRNRRSTE